MPAIKKVLLLGDSIRMSYQPLVAELLNDRAEVVGPADNCQFSLFTLSSINRWIEALGKPDVVHWNNGIHDCGHNPERSPVQIPIEMYRKNLEFILRRLREFTTDIIWATSTPVHPDRPFRDTEWSWRNDEIERYNDSARELMIAGSIPINDLHGLVRENMELYLSDDQLHLSESGQEVCATAAADAITKYLE